MLTLKQQFVEGKIMKFKCVKSAKLAFKNLKNELALEREVQSSLNQKVQFEEK